MADVYFYKLPVGIAERRDLKPSDKIVFAVVYDKIGGNGFCWPGVRTIARESGLTTTTVTDSIRRLETSGLLTARRGGRGKSTHYSIAESALETNTLPKPKRVRNYYSGVLETTTQAREKLTPNQREQLNQSVRATKLQKPTPGEVTAYAREIGYTLDGQYFCDKYEGIGWVVGRNRTPMRDWRAVVRTWKQREEQGKPKREPQRGDPDWLPTEEEVDEIHAQCEH